LKRFLFLVLFFFISFNLCGFTLGTLQTPSSGKFYIPAGAALFSDGENLSLASDIGLIYGLGHGASLDFSWTHPFYDNVMNEDIFLLSLREDFTISKRLALTLAGGASKFNEDWLFPLRGGIKVVYPAATLAGGVALYVDMAEKNPGSAWGAIEFAMGRFYKLKFEYNYFIFDKVGLDHMAHLNFVIRM